MNILSGIILRKSKNKLLGTLLYCYLIWMLSLDYSCLLVIPMLVVLAILVATSGGRYHYALLLMGIALSGMPFRSTMVDSKVVNVFYDYELMPLGITGLLFLYLDMLMRVRKA